MTDHLFRIRIRAIFADVCYRFYVLADSKLSGPTVDDLTASSSVKVVGGVPYLEVGFNAYRAPQYWPADNEWRVDYASQCTEYDPDVVTMDVFWKMGKAFEFFSLVLGGGGALFLWFSSCFVFSPVTWRWAGHEVMAAAIFQSCAFVWFANAMCRTEGNTCALFFGSKADIAAAMFWLTSAVAIYCRYPSPQPREGQGAGSASGQGDVEMSGTGTGGNGEDGEIEDLQFENDELPLDGDAMAKMDQGEDENPELEVPANKDDHEII